MPINVEQLTSEVDVVNDSTARETTSSNEQRPEDEQKTRAALARMIRDRQRTAARGFDD